MSDNQCTYEFSYPDRPYSRDRCNLSAGKNKFCIFHAPYLDIPESEFCHHLEVEVKKGDHWLEGSYIKADLTQIGLKGAKLPFANFEGRSLNRVILRGALLEGANFNSAIFDHVVMTGSNLRRSIFDLAKFEPSDDMSVDFRNADLGGTSFIGARIRSARLFGVRFSAPTPVKALLDGTSYEMENGSWDQAATILATVGKRANEDWDFVQAEKAAFLATTCRHRLAIQAGPLRDKSWCADWLKPTLRSGLIGFGWIINRAIWGYGLKPLRLFGVMLLVVVIYGAIIFPLAGITRPDGKPLVFPSSLVDTLILSINMFVALTVGPLTFKNSLGEFLAGTEAWIGSGLMSIFLVALAGKYLRRFGG